MERRGNPAVAPRKDAVLNLREVDRIERLARRVLMEDK
jgi:hypothetical protein